MKVTKINLEVLGIKKMLENMGLDIEDVNKLPNEELEQLTQLGIDLPKILNSEQEIKININLNQVIAYGEPKEIPGFPQVRGFHIWVSGSKDPWFIAEEDYETFKTGFEKL